MLRFYGSLLRTYSRLLTRLRLSGIVLFILTALLAPIPALPDSHLRPSAAISYTLSIEDTKSQLLRVQITLPIAGSDPIDFTLPAWTPGYYQILHFEDKIERISATDGNGNEVQITHPSARIWHIQPTDPRSPLFLTYSVHADDPGLGFFASALTETEGYVNGASVFMFVSGKTSLPAHLVVNLPAGWRIATPLVPEDASQSTLPDSNRSFYQARNYEELIDRPIQFGRFDTAQFKQDGVTFHCIFVGKHEADKQQINEKLARIVHSIIQIFGTPPFQHYYFIYHISNEGDFYGGLEHANSTVIHFAPPLRSGSDDDFLAISAHEFFHAWNVKRIRPIGLGPFDLTQPVRTPSLWFAEGITDYYSLLIPYRARLRSREWFLKELEVRIAELEEAPARTQTSLEVASRKAWEGMSIGYNGLSYYLKGSLVGFYFDLRIRELTQGEKSLDDVMRLLDSRFGSRNLPYSEADVLAAINEVSHTDLTQEYRRYVSGTDDLDWEETLTKAGLLLDRDRSSTLGIHLDAMDRDRSPTPDEEDALPLAIVATVEQGSAGALMGIRPGDRILRLNTEPVTLDTLAPLLRKLPPHTPITLQIRRGAQKLTLIGKTDVMFSNHKLSALPEVQQTLASLRILQGLAKPQQDELSRPR